MELLDKLTILADAARMGCTRVIAIGGGTVLDIAKILLFLCSDDSAPLNGQALVADYGANL